MNAILPISYIREKSIINNNVDEAIIKPIIFVVQDLYLRPALGSDLYNLILTQTTPPTSLSSVNKTLVDEYVIPFLHWYLVSEFCVAMKFRFMNKGIVEKNSENSQPISTEDLKFIEKRYAGYAQNYDSQLRNYIQAHPTDYPAYFTNSGRDKTQPDRQSFKIGWYFPGYRSFIDGRRDDIDKQNNPSWPD